LLGSSSPYQPESCLNAAQFAGSGFLVLDRTFGGQPRELGAELARIDTGKGQERLFADQAPQLLRTLSEHARIASITASNAIENVTVAKDRAERIAEGSPRGAGSCMKRS
jgi:hypothetical protein